MKRDFYGVSEFIKENGGVENFRCFAQMRRIEMVIPFMGISVVSDSNMTWMECKIDERHYKVEDGYKITLVPLQEGFAKEDFYQSDFMSLIRSGCIIPKESDDQHVERVHFIEPLCGSAYIVHEGDAVVRSM